MSLCRPVLVAVVFASLPLAIRADEGDAMISLFNGHDLEGWVAEGVTEIKDGDATRPVWTVEDGKIVCAGNGFGFLRYTKRPFDDFVFHVEYKMQPGGNTGVGIRTTEFDPSKSRATRPSFYSYEIQLVDDAGSPPPCIVPVRSTDTSPRAPTPSSRPASGTRWRFSARGRGSRSR